MHPCRVRHGGHLPSECQRVFLLERIKGNGHGKTAIAADLHRVFTLYLLAGIQQGGTGVFLVGELIATDFHADEALHGERMRREGLHICFQSTDKALAFFNLLREVFQQIVLQPELLALVVCFHNFELCNIHI